MRKAEVSLRQAKDLPTICKLKRDNYDVGPWSIMTDGRTVWISKQKVGEKPTDQIAIPKHIFDRLLACYEKPKLVSSSHQ